MGQNQTADQSLDKERQHGKVLQEPSTQLERGWNTQMEREKDGNRDE